ncbi:MAG: phosphopantothenoylcysteine decarboxylase [Planctomycetota bacterium]
MPDDLAGRPVLITSGPTRADVDAVRYVSNRSSGRLGRRIALEALARGARVTLVAGRGSAVPERREVTRSEADRLTVRRVETVGDVLAALEPSLSERPPEAVIHAMAVLDYAPEKSAARKTPSGREEWTLRMVRTPKVIRSIREWAPRACLTQFKLEVGVTRRELTDAALDSLRRNRAEIVVANDLDRIRGERHPALILDAAGQVLAEPRTKGAIARSLCHILAERL